MAAFADRILQFFHDEGWHLVEVEPGRTWQQTFKGDQGLWTCYVQIREEFFQFTFYSICPIIVPEPRRTAMAELLTRANSRLQLGNFEMEFDGGELRYRTSLSLDDNELRDGANLSLDSSELNDAVLRPLAYINVKMMDRFLPAIVAVIYGGVAPLAALEDSGILSASGPGNQEIPSAQHVAAVGVKS